MKLLRIALLSALIPILLLAGHCLAADKNAGVKAGKTRPVPQPPGDGTEQAMEKVAYLGVATAPIAEATAAHLDLPRGVGLSIEYVDDNSPASGKLERHDVLHKLNDQILIEPKQLAVLVRTFKPGDKVNLTVIRKGKSLQVTAELAEKEMPRLEQQGWQMPPIKLMPPSGMHQQMLPPFQGKFHDDIEDMLQDSGIGGDRINQLMERMEKMFRGEGGPGGMSMKGAPPRTNMRMSVAGSSASTLTRVDKEHSIALSTDEKGDRRLKVTSRDGKTQFDGPVNTDEEINKVPKEIRGKLPELEERGEPPVLPPLRQGDKQIF